MNEPKIKPLQAFMYVSIPATLMMIQSKVIQIGQLTTELAAQALEHLKLQCLHFFLVAIYQILYQVGGNKDMHYDNILLEFEFWPAALEHLKN